MEKKSHHELETFFSVYWNCAYFTFSMVLNIGCTGKRLFSPGIYCLPNSLIFYRRCRSWWKFFYHWIILFVGCFPASIFAMLSLVKRWMTRHLKCTCLNSCEFFFWVVLILFSIVKTKIIHYSSLCYFPITYLAAYTCYKLINGSFVWKRWMTLLVLAIGGIFSAVFTLLPFLPYFKKN